MLPHSLLSSQYLIHTHLGSELVLHKYLSEEWMKTKNNHNSFGVRNATYHSLHTCLCLSVPAEGFENVFPCHFQDQRGLAHGEINGQNLGAPSSLKFSPTSQRFLSLHFHQQHKSITISLEESRTSQAGVHQHQGHWKEWGGINLSHPTCIFLL